MQGGLRPQEEGEGAVPSEDALRRVCEELCRGWSDAYSKIESIELGSDNQSPDAVRFTIVLAFVSHTYHVTIVAADLMHANDYLSAIPLLRVGYESALTAVWAAHSEEAARALHNQYVETARKLQGSAARTGWFDDMVADLAPREAVDVAPSARGQAANFADLCLALEPDGQWLYTMYRLLSAYSHPSGSIVKLFAPGDVGDPVSLSPKSDDDVRSWWHAAATNLLHAGQALDALDPKGRRRDSLAAAGELIGWAEPLRLSASAAAKVAEARAER